VGLYAAAFHAIISFWPIIIITNNGREASVFVGGAYQSTQYIMLYNFNIYTVVKAECDKLVIISHIMLEATYISCQNHCCHHYKEGRGVYR